MTPTQRYQRWVKAQQGPKYPAPPLTHDENAAWEPIQKTFRLPRWVVRAIQQASEQAGEQDSAIARAWLMDAAEQWLTSHGHDAPSP